MPYAIAYDLGTGGIKASIFSHAGTSVASVFIQYDTYYPKENWHEQRPMDWWDSVCKSTHLLLEKSGMKSNEILSLALSGHSLVAAPIDKMGNLLLKQVPIWSDMRANKIAQDYFKKHNYDDWYMKTGNGDPPECYSIFKLMWLKKHMPEVYNKTDITLGSKDFINYKLTGNKCTDPSYASGTGVFDLCNWKYSDELIANTGLPKSFFPTIVPSHSIIGEVTYEAAKATGLTEGTMVACGGVDNSCMALGARGIGEGRTYTSVGSSGWIAVTSKKPILDTKQHPFVFAHIEEGYYTSATSIFSAGNSFRWIRDTLCADISQDEDSYEKMNEWANDVPVGSNGVLFNPSLAGGSAQEKSSNINGGFLGLTLKTTKEDMVRACMEGIALNLRKCLEILRQYVPCDDEMLICGGGSKSPLWLQMFADIYKIKVIKSNIDQDAASLGAAAIALRGYGMWEDYSKIDSLHSIQDIKIPVDKNIEKYEKLYDIFLQYSSFLSDIGNQMNELSDS